MNSTKKNELLSVHDRNLLQKNRAYFFQSSTETLIVWEERVRKAIKDMNQVEKNQPTMKKICDEHMNVSESIKTWRSLQKWVKKNSDNVKDKTNNNRIKK